MRSSVTPKDLKPIPSEELIGESLPDIKGRIKICDVHKKDTWQNGTYEWDNGAIVCPNCGWGTRIPGYMRLVNGKIVDLRIVSSQDGQDLAR